MNTEIPEWARDDIATPELLERWLRGRGLLGGEETVDAAGFVAARELRSSLRALAVLTADREVRLERSASAARPGAAVASST